MTTWLSQSSASTESFSAPCGSVAWTASSTSETEIGWSCKCAFVIPSVNAERG